MVTLALYAGIFLTLLGLIGLGACIRKAMAVKRGAADGSSASMHKLVALNMAAVGTAFLGLALVTVGLIFG